LPRATGSAATTSRSTSTARNAIPPKLVDPRRAHDARLRGRRCDADRRLPPCQEYSYMAMPWGRAKAKAGRCGRADSPRATGARARQLTASFDACFRIQREACDAAGPAHSPWWWRTSRAPSRGSAARPGTSVPTTSGATCRRSCPALSRSVKVKDGMSSGIVRPVGDAFNRERRARLSGSRRPKGRRLPVRHRLALRSRTVTGQKPGSRSTSPEGRKGAGAGAEWFDQNLCKLSSKSSARKAASAKIAKIPFALSSHIARVYKPEPIASAAA
jgi:hypothetical protein